MSDLVPFAVSNDFLAEIAGLFPGQSNKDLTEGVQPSFAVVTFRGKVWRVRYKGEDKVIKAANGDPVSSIVGVIVKSSPAISKLYYAKAYTEGDDVPPDCYSMDGIKPEASATNRQSVTCAACPHNVWGSRISEAGNKGKACADNRRVALVPYPDLKNDMFGGPMLLRVPPTSLQELGRFGDALRQSQLPYQAVVVKISFDYEVAYPKLIFSAVRPLTREEMQVVSEYMQGDQVVRMLMEPVQGDETHADAEKAAEPRPADPVPADAPKPKPAPASPVEAPVPEPVEGITLAAEPEPEPVKEKKQSPAKAAAAPAEVVSQELGNLITNLLQ
jgi:hypothetical protein